MLLIVLLFMTIVLPLAWLAADLRASATVRRILGVLAILWSFGIASLVGILESLNSNVYFTSATKTLLETSVQQLHAGKNEAVLREWTRANDEFQPTYENRGRYQEIVDRAVAGMKE